MSKNVVSRQKVVISCHKLPWNLELQLDYRHTLGLVELCSQMKRNALTPVLDGKSRHDPSAIQSMTADSLDLGHQTTGQTEQKDVQN